MRKLTIWLASAALTFLIGVGATLIWVANRPYTVSPEKMTLDSLSPAGPNEAPVGSPCREGLVSVESLPKAPLQLSILTATCQNSRPPHFSFEVENVSTKTIRDYQVFLLWNYEGRVARDGSGTGRNGSFFQPHQRRIESLDGDGSEHGPDGLSLPDRKGYVLTVCAVTFTDDTTWRNSALLCE